MTGFTTIKKALLISDMHGTSRFPVNRLGNPLDDYREKLEYIFKHAHENKCCIVSSGDVFDKPRDILALFTFLSVHEKYPDVEFFTIYGQHDMYYRSLDAYHNLAILEKAGVIRILSMNPVYFGEFALYGSSWGHFVDEDAGGDDKFHCLLAIHAPISDKALFPDHEFKPAKKFAKRYDEFQVILAGDIHRQWLYYNKATNNYICNTGPMMRLESSDYMRQHKPCFFVYEAGVHELLRYYIPCKPAEEVLKERHVPNEETSALASLGQIYIYDGAAQEFDVANIVWEIVKTSRNQQGILAVLKELSHEFRRFTRETSGSKNSNRRSRKTTTAKTSRIKKNRRKKRQASRKEIKGT